MINPVKTYKTNRNEPVRILCTNLRCADYPIVAAITDRHGNEFIAQFSTDGKVIQDDLDPFLEIVEASPWDDFKVDEPVYVRNKTGVLHQLHFARVIGGKPATWPHGRTSWSCGDELPILWDECTRKP